MKGLFKDLRGILVSNAIISAILNRQPKGPMLLEDLEPPKASTGYSPDMSKWVNAKPSKIEPYKQERVELSVADIKEIMDEHENRLQTGHMALGVATLVATDNMSAQFEVDGRPFLKASSDNKGDWTPVTPQDIANHADDIMARQRELDEFFASGAGKSPHKLEVKNSLDLRHERDTQAVAIRSPGLGFQNTARGAWSGMGTYEAPNFVGTGTEPEFSPHLSFSSPMMSENRAERRQREREEKRNSKKRGKK